MILVLLVTLLIHNWRLLPVLYLSGKRLTHGRVVLGLLASLVVLRVLVIHLLSLRLLLLIAVLCILSLPSTLIPTQLTKILVLAYLTYILAHRLNKRWGWGSRTLYVSHGAIIRS